MIKKVKKNNKDVTEEEVKKFLNEWEDASIQEERLQRLIELAKKEERDKQIKSCNETLKQERADFRKILDETRKEERAKHKKEIDAFKRARGKERQENWDSSAKYSERIRKEAFQEGASDSNLGWFVLLIPIVVFLFIFNND